MRLTPYKTCVFLLFASTTTTAFTVVQFSRQQHQKQYRLQRQSLYAAAPRKDLSEFDYLLRETSTATSVAPTASRRRIALSPDTDGTRTTLVASAFPGAAIQEDGTAEIEDDPYANAFDGQMGKIQQFQEQAQSNTMESKIKSMDLQDIVLTFIIPGVVVFAGARWAFNRVGGKVVENTDEMLGNFAREMIYHDGDLKEMELCVKDYKSKLVWMGPARSDAMLKRYLEQYAKKKTVSPQAIASLSYVFTMFKLSEEKAANVLVALCKQMGADKISSSGKLLFFGTRILKSPEGVIALKPIKEMIMSTYREQSVAESLVETSQR